jgi:hypothetical protein
VIPVAFPAAGFFQVTWKFEREGVMKRFIRTFASVLVPAFILAGVASSPAMAQEKMKEAKAEKGQATRKVLLENDKVQVFEVTFKPGDENKAVPSSSYRVLRALSSGTIQRTYAEGKTEKVEYKTGDVRMNEPSKQTYTAKNIGKTDVVLYVVVLKQAK